jgi:hypothetical protein
VTPTRVRAILKVLGLLRPLRVPGLPTVPRFLALVSLSHPRLVPHVLRWKAASRGLGLVIARLAAAELEPSVAETSRGVGAGLQAIGAEQGRAIRAQLGYGRDPRECARTVALANRLFDINASVLAVGPDEARVVTPGCPWSRESWWGQAPCGAFSRYEVGLAGGLNRSVRVRYECKRSRGDDRCVGVYTWKEPGPGPP